MHKSKTPHIVAAIFIFVGAALWIWNVMTIDYSKILGSGQSAQSAVSNSAQTPDVVKQGQP